MVKNVIGQLSFVIKHSGDSIIIHGNPNDKIHVTNDATN